MVVEASPVRPVPPERPAPAAQITPNVRASQETGAPRQITLAQELMQAETKLEELRRKTAEAATKLARGEFNQAQFAAVHAHYNEQRTLIERMLERDPKSKAWQRVAQPGHTSFLVHHYEARIQYYAIHDHSEGAPEAPITAQGSPPIPPDIVKKILVALRIVMRHHPNPGPGLKPLSESRDAGQWILLTPGQFTAAIMLFSLKPSNQQVKLMQDIHREFERANRVTLERNIRAADQLVFPHRALFTGDTGSLR